ncbi:hypothetical protein FOMPIDRAFT_100765 [Fomitopsis schrenkii]|uniref:Uncharacterized protein n=1 Tax=Fomitopsis schrenkii TaxID=2126942 RepID=S8E4D0_FOMSC|nr:hypothetical protein FOMPIDRAFT_100765 [Fomitopsis schrenkii]
MNLLLPIVDENHVDSEFMIRPVSLTRLKPFLYRPDPVDEMVPPSKILSPRDYGCFYRDERRAFYGDYPITRFYPLEMHEKIFNENEEDKEGLIRVKSLSETSAAAPSKVCVLSGDKLNIAVNWILPPSRVDRAAVQGGLVPDADIHECVENLLTMRSDLYSKFWLSHSLAVDVDDDFRIRAFTKDASDLKNLRQQLWQPSNLPEASRLYFREHFKLALSYYLAGGDVRKGNDASTPAQNNFMNEVGVGRNTPPDEAKYTQYENRWQEPMGIEILSTIWPLSELPSMAQEVVRGDSLEDSMTGLALK